MWFMSNNSEFKTDIIIVGAGPVGLFAIFQAGMLKMHCNIIDSLDMIGGQCSALYPEKPIYDIPAHPHILAQDLINNLEQQASPFRPIYHLGQTVESVTRSENKEITVTTSKNIKITGKVLIIAAGCGAFGPNRPPLDNIREFEGKTVFYMVNKREDFRNKDIVIAGGGDSAIDWAINLSSIANSVSLIHRRNKFRCAPESHDRMMQLVKSGKLNLVVPYQLEALNGQNGIIEEVIVSDLDGNKKHLKANVLLAFFGLSMELGPIANWGLNIHKKHILVEQSTMQTSTANIYAIGDIAHYDNKLKLILSGFSEAATACHCARNIVFPDTENHFEYSTTSGVPSL